MGMMARADLICSEDEFVLNTLFADLCAVRVDEKTTMTPIEPGTRDWTVKFLYRGGTGENQADAFNIYMWKRSDIVNADGIARTEGTRTAPDPNVPTVDQESIYPPRPLSGRPVLTEAEKDAYLEDGTQPDRDVYIDGDISEVYHVGSFRVVQFPGTGEDTPASRRIHENTAFTGTIELVRNAS